MYGEIVEETRLSMTVARLRPQHNPPELQTSLRRSPSSFTSTTPHPYTHHHNSIQYGARSRLSRSNALLHPHSPRLHLGLLTHLTPHRRLLPAIPPLQCASHQLKVSRAAGLPTTRFPTPTNGHAVPLPCVFWPSLPPIDACKHHHPLRAPANGLGR